MMSDVKVSVIMPSLNVKSYIEQCIESVINQTLKDIEIICVDAYSEDGTLEILEEYAKKDSRIKILYSDKKSYGHQMNLGIGAASGEYIGIVETDDFIDEKMFETLYELTNNGSTDISKVSFYHYFNDGFKRKDWEKKNIPASSFSVYEYSNILNGHPSIWAGIYKRSFLKENNITFIEAPGGGWVDNPFFFETMLAAESITYSKNQLYYYRQDNPDSSTNNLADLTLPMSRMMDNLDVLNQFSCDNEDIHVALYVRIFWHVRDVLTKDNFQKQKKEALTSIYEVFNRLDDNIIISNFSIEDQKLYYKYSSPLNMGVDLCNLSNDDFDNILKENDFLYDYISKIEKENGNEIMKNKKLSKKLNNIMNSKSYKMSLLLSKPINKIRNILK